MIEHPILFTGEMVEAILDGRKTQTRRVIKPQIPVDATEVFYWYHGPFPASMCAEQGCWYWHPAGLVHHRKCPYGEPGDRLWVKESWAPQVLDEGRIYQQGDAVIYRTDFCGEALDYPWRSSRFMPRWVSRITLEIIKVRVERVQEIGGTDAWQEGGFTVTQFIDLWDSINAKRGYGWDANPWVWVIDFKKLEAS